MPTCPICNKEMKYINNSHLKSHNLTPTEFKVMYPEVESISEDSRSRLSNNGGFGAQASKVACFLKYRSKYEQNPKSCAQCSKILSYEERRKKFCSSSCSASFNNKGRVVIYSEEAKQKLRKIGEAIGKQSYYKLGKTIHNKICIICSISFETTYQTKLNKTCSHQCKKRWHAINNPRQNKTFGKCGYYKGIYCASSWELAFLIYNTDLGKDIQRCNLTFDYIMNEQARIYFPDFLMEDKIYEVKGRELDDVALKTQAVVDAGYQIELIRKKEINPIIKFLKEKYKVKDLTELYDKKD
jgi:hypothetical protein